MELVLAGVALAFFMLWAAFNIFKKDKKGINVTVDFGEEGQKITKATPTVEIPTPVGPVVITRPIKKPPRGIAKREEYYNKIIAEDIGARASVRLDNGLIVDMVDDTHAYEIDFGGMKTYEGIGQCLVYSYFTGLKPGLVILIRDEKEEKLFNKIRPAIPSLGIDLTIYRVLDRTTGEYGDYKNEDN